MQCNKSNVPEFQNYSSADNTDGHLCPLFKPSHILPAFQQPTYSSGNPYPHRPPLLQLDPILSSIASTVGPPVSCFVTPDVANRYPTSTFSHAPHRAQEEHFVESRHPITEIAWTMTFMASLPGIILIKAANLIMLKISFEITSIRKIFYAIVVTVCSYAFIEFKTEFKCK